MSNVVSLEEWRKRRAEKQMYKSYRVWITSEFKITQQPISHYDFAVARQQNPDYYLYRFFFPDYDW